MGNCCRGKVVVITQATEHDKQEGTVRFIPTKIIESTEGEKEKEFRNDTLDDASAGPGVSCDVTVSSDVKTVARPNQLDVSRVFKVSSEAPLIKKQNDICNSGRASETNTSGYGPSENWSISTPVSEVERGKVTQCYSYLRENIIAESVCDHLEANDVIIDSEREEILAEKSLSMRAERLLQVLLLKPRFGEAEYKHFIDALVMAKSNFIAEYIEKQANKILEGAEQTVRLKYPLDKMKQSVEVQMHAIADQIDGILTARFCLEKGGISIEDYAAIYKQQNRRSASRALLKVILSDTEQSFSIFLDALKSHGGESALEVIDEYCRNQDNRHPEQKSEPRVCVCCDKSDIHMEIQGRRQSMHLNIDFKDTEINRAVLKSMKDNPKKFYKAFVQTLHSQFVNAEDGSIIIHLKALNDGNQQLVLSSDNRQPQLCALIAEIISTSGVLDFIKHGTAQLTVTLVTEDVEDEFTVRESQTVTSSVWLRESVACEELNPYKYTRELYDSGMLAEDIQANIMKNSTRRSAMRALVDVISQSSSWVQTKFLELVKINEHKVVYERIVWNGKDEELVKGILTNYEYLVDELVPARLLQLLPSACIEPGTMEELLQVARTDRRMGTIVLLQHVLVNKGDVLRRFYDALFEAGYTETADRIRKSGKQCADGYLEDEGLGSMASKEPTSYIHNGSHCLFRGDFTVHIKQAEMNDVVIDVPLSRVLRLSKSSSESQLFRGSVDTAPLKGLDISNENIDDADRAWASNDFSMSIRRQETRDFEFIPLHWDREGVIEVSIFSARQTKFVIVEKEMFRQSQSMTVSISEEGDFSFESSLPSRLLGELESVGQATLSILSHNVKSRMLFSKYVPKVAASETTATENSVKDSSLHMIPPRRKTLTLKRSSRRNDEQEQQFAFPGHVTRIMDDDEGYARSLSTDGLSSRASTLNRDALPTWQMK